jgi:hypothetical protein
MSDAAYIEEKDQTNVGRIPSNSTSTTSALPELPSDTEVQEIPVSKDVEGAVYSYVQAVRSLGRTRVTASEIADALSLRTRVVLMALENLQAKGVKKKAPKQPR